MISTSTSARLLDRHQPKGQGRARAYAAVEASKADMRNRKEMSAHHVIDLPDRGRLVAGTECAESEDIVALSNTALQG